MSEVNDRRDAQRAEQARVQQEAGRKQSQKRSDAFRQRLAQQQQTTQQGGQRPGGARGQAAAQTKFGAVQQLMQQANQKLQDNRSSELGKNKEMVKERVTEQRQDKDTAISDEGRRTEHKDELHEQARYAIGRDSDQGDGAGSGSGGGGGAGADGGTGDGAGSGEAIGMAMTAQGASGTGEAQGAAHVPRIPPEALQELVKNVMVGFDKTKGIGTVVVQLNDMKHLRGGGTVVIHVKDRQLDVTVKAEDSLTRQMFGASEGDLSRALQSKGLNLASYKIESQ